jgi:hypothetical protein
MGSLVWLCFPLDLRGRIGVRFDVSPSVPGDLYNIRGLHSGLRFHLHCIVFVVL